MSLNKFGQAGMGIGAVYGVPTTIAVAETSTVNITGTAYATQQYYMANAVSGAMAGIRLQYVATGLGVTGTYTIFSASGGHFYNDNSGFQIVNTTTSVQICLIPA